MNRSARKAATAVLILLMAAGGALSAQSISFRKSLTAADRRCLADLLQTGHWSITPQFHGEMAAAAWVAREHLKRGARAHYLFVIEEPGSCGTAGCSMLIGEMGGDGTCHEIYSGSGFKHVIAVLRQRDYGYRRLYTPCELRFDGHEYRLLHEECPSVDVQR